MDNANPTVIDVSALPTRLGKEAADGPRQLHERIAALSLLPRHREPRDAADSAVPELVLEALGLEAEDEEDDPVDAQEIFDLVASISDPEHPLTLAQLAVVSLSDIEVPPARRDEVCQIVIRITPTITHCSLATLIGLGIRVRLERCLPPRFRIKILIKEGTHQLENQVNKQLGDKERVAAACENDQLLGVILQMLSTCE